MTETQEVDDDALVLRRVVPQHKVPVIDRENTFRVSSAAFTDSSDGSGMSVVIKPIADALGLGPEDVIDGYAPGCGLVSLVTGDLRADDQTVAHDPVVREKPHPCDPAHGSVVRAKPKGRVRKWARSAVWVLIPS